MPVFCQCASVADALISYTSTIGCGESVVGISVTYTGREESPSLGRIIEKYVSVVTVNRTDTESAVFCYLQASSSVHHRDV